MTESSHPDKKSNFLEWYSSHLDASREEINERFTAWHLENAQVDIGDGKVLADLSKSRESYFTNITKEIDQTQTMMQHNLHSEGEAPNGHAAKLDEPAQRNGRRNGQHAAKPNNGQHRNGNGHHKGNGHANGNGHTNGNGHANGKHEGNGQVNGKPEERSRG